MCNDCGLFILVRPDSMKQPSSKTEMSSFNISHEEDSSSTNSNEYTYQDTKKVPLNGYGLTLAC